MDAVGPGRRAACRADSRVGEPPWVASWRSPWGCAIRSSSVPCCVPRLVAGSRQRLPPGRRLFHAPTWSAGAKNRGSSTTQRDGSDARPLLALACADHPPHAVVAPLGHEFLEEGVIRIGPVGLGSRKEVDRSGTVARTAGAVGSLNVVLKRVLTAPAGTSCFGCWAAHLVDRRSSAAELRDRRTGGHPCEAEAAHHHEHGAGSHHQHPVAPDRTR